MEHDEVDRAVEAGEIVAAALAALPRDWRECLWLRYYEDLLPREIATQLGVPHETVRTRMRRGLAALREDVRKRLDQRGLHASVLLPLAALEPCSIPTLGLASDPIALSLVMQKSLLVAAAALAAVGLWSVTAHTSPSGVHVPAAETSSTRAQRVDVALETAGPAPSLSAQLDSGGEALRRRPVASNSTAVVTARVTVVDRHARNSVPFFELSAAWEGGESRISTDLNGVALLPNHVASVVRLGWTEDRSEWGTAPGAVAELALTATDSTPVVAFRPDSKQAPNISRNVTHDWEWPPTESAPQIPLTVVVGPTWLLNVQYFDGSQIPGADSILARLTPRGSSGGRAQAQVHRTGDQHWVRFAHNAASGLEGVLDLELRSDDGLWLGSARIDRTSGFDPVPLAIVLEAQAVLHGRITDPNGAPLADVAIKAQYPNGGEVRGGRTDTDGTYSIACLPPGFTTAFVSDPRFEPYEGAVHLRAGERSELDIVLRQLDGGGRIGGVIESTTGLFEEQVFLFLVGIDGSRYWARSDPKFADENGAWVARFTFDDVPPGQLRLTCNTMAPYPISENSVVVEAPAESLHFLVEDTRAPIELTARAVNASGDVLDSFSLHYRVNHQYWDHATGTANLPIELDLATGVSVEWTMFAPGRAPVSGNELAFKGGRLDVLLESGWGVRINLLEVESLRGIPDIEVFADGASVGRTDGEGELVVILPESPRRITFDRTRWLVHDGTAFHSDLDPETGQVRDRENETYINAYLRPVR